MISIWEIVHCFEVLPIDFVLYGIYLLILLSIHVRDAIHCCDRVMEHFHDRATLHRVLNVSDHDDGGSQSRVGVNACWVINYDEIVCRQR